MEYCIYLRTAACSRCHDMVFHILGGDSIEHLDLLIARITNICTKHADGGKGMLKRRRQRSDPN